MPETIPILQEATAGPIDVSRPTDDPYGNAKIHGKGRRLRLFLGLFVFTSALGITYCLLRPAMYQAVAVLILKPASGSEAAGAAGSLFGAADKSELVVAQQVLTSHSILDQVRETLHNDPLGRQGAEAVSLKKIKQMVRVELIPEGNLIRLFAEGPDPNVAVRTLASWISVYMKAFEEYQNRALAASMDSLDREIGGLEDRLEAKRKELEIFRKLNDITSLQREENQLVSRLRGLNDSLVRARERLVNARARLQSLEEAQSRGEDILEGRELRLVTSLEEKAESLRDQLRELGMRYTERYMALDPKVRNLRSQLERTEEKIRTTRIQAERAVLDAARQEVFGAQKAAADLEEQIKEHKSKIQDFNEKFSKHEALLEEVKSLEALVRNRAQNRLQKDVAPEQTVPKLSLLESPTVSERPVRPHYLRDVGIVAAGSLLLSLLGIWLVEFLQRSPERKEPAQSTTLIFQPNVLHSPDTAEKKLLGQPQRSEAKAVWRELSPLEIKAMVEKAAPEEALILGLLLSGVKEEEVESLRWEHVHLQEGFLDIPGPYSRRIPLPGLCVRALQPMINQRQGDAGEGTLTGREWGGLLLVDLQGVPLKVQEIRKRLTCLAQEAGLAAPSEVTPECLRHTYLLFLVRQGIRLSSLETVVGKVSPDFYAQYGIYAPPGPGKDPQNMVLRMPVLD